MESRIQQKCDEHLRQFKTQIRNWLVEQGATVKHGETDMTNEFLQYMFDHENLQLEKEDFQRRKRVKNQVPLVERCRARRANGDQCTRRRLDANFCGTHSKGAPHGVVDEDGQEAQPSIEKIEIWMQDIQGICCYIDKDRRVYSPEDIVGNKSYPAVIGEWYTTRQTDGTLTYHLDLKH